MLDPIRNRLDYGFQLRPPNGYELDHAVTTTYTLDLEAILLIPVALFYAEYLGHNTKVVKPGMLEALTKASEQISIYYQRGKISVPSTYNYLMAYWEKGLNPVRMSKYNQSFHPKIWLIRFKSLTDGDAKYRFLCTSRNLTYSRDWDMAFSSDGGLVDASVYNGGLIKFLQYLNLQSPKGILETMISELSHIEFDLPEGFDSLEFLPIGIDEKEAFETLTFDPEIKRRLIMSPFIDKTTLKRLSNVQKECYLLSSFHALSEIDKPTLNQFEEVYMFSTEIEEAENYDTLEESELRKCSQSLHAKYYVNEYGNHSEWLLGSANATSPATRGNIEFMVRLTTELSKYKPSKIKNKLTSANENDSRLQLFRLYEGEVNPTDETKLKEEKVLRMLIYSITQLTIKGEATRNEDGLYDLSIYLPIINVRDEKVVITVKPLPERLLEAVVIHHNISNVIDQFGSYELYSLSPFVIFDILLGSTRKSFLLKIDISLDHNRLNNIFAQIINNKAKFLTYLSFLLDGDMGMVDLEESGERANKGTSQNTSEFSIGSPVYEKMLIAASRNPGLLNDTDKFIQRMLFNEIDNDNKLLPQKFKDMWEVFRKYKVEND